MYKSHLLKLGPTGNTGGVGLASLKSIRDRQYAKNKSYCDYLDRYISFSVQGNITVMMWFLLGLYQTNHVPLCLENMTLGCLL